MGVLSRDGLVEAHADERPPPVGAIETSAGKI
jgi:hypothetical protein